MSTSSDQAEIWYGRSWGQVDYCRAFKIELRIALRPPGAEITTFENTTFSLIASELWSGRKKNRGNRFLEKIAILRNSVVA